MASRTVSIELMGDEALVLFDLLARVDSEGCGLIADEADQQVLWRMEAQLEKALTEPLEPKYRDLLADARRRIRGVGD